MRSYPHTAAKSVALTATLAAAIALVLPCQAQTSDASKKRTVWVDPPMGSLLGRGSVDTGYQKDSRSTNSTVAAGEKPDFTAALNELDALSGTLVEGWSMIGPAVSLQTGVPVETVKQQRDATGLSFGEILVANSLAKGSSKSFNEIVRLKGASKNWSGVAKHLNINIDSVTVRLRAASDAVKHADSRRRNRREQNIRDNMVDPLRSRQPGG
jgi:hypothetical protein